MAFYALFFHQGIRHWSFTVAALPILVMGIALTWMLLRQRDTRFVIPSRLTAAFLGIYTLVLTYRCVLSLRGASHLSGDSPWANPAWMYSMLALMLMSYCLLLMYVLFTVVEMHSSVAYAAGIDPLTGALNRRAWTKHASRELARCERRGQPVALVAIDLDNFKRVNDTHGHGGGDVALCAFVDLVKEQLRPEDMIARLGGEEFALLLPGMDTLDAACAADNLRHSLEQMRVHYDGRMIQTTASAGVTVMQPGESLEEMLKRADDLLYRAKSEGRNLVVTDEPVIFPARPVLVEKFGIQTGRTA
jgi:diguanylate cyclase (GGDEF)-like protein